VAALQTVHHLEVSQIFNSIDNRLIVPRYLRTIGTRLIFTKQLLKDHCCFQCQNKLRIKFSSGFTPDVHHLEVEF
jgi:hypothetical protein